MKNNMGFSYRQVGGGGRGEERRRRRKRRRRKGRRDSGWGWDGAEWREAGMRRDEENEVEVSF